MKQCCICYEEFPHLISLICNHEFCKNCVNSIINNSLTLKCALCRETSYEINDKQIDEKILKTTMFGRSYIDWELFLESYFKQRPYYKIIIYLYYGEYSCPYIYHKKNLRNYKCIKN